MEIIWHHLKTWPEMFNAAMFSIKSFDLRVNDRDFKVGEYVALKEWDPVERLYSGRILSRQIQYILRGGFGLPENMVILGLMMV